MKIDVNAIKLQIRTHFRLTYNMELKQPHLDDIHANYHQLMRAVMLELLLYRFVNLAIGTVILLFVFFFAGNWVNWFVWLFFVVYNMVHGIISWLKYTKIKRTKIKSHGDKMV